MKSFGLGTYALTGGVSVALLAGCGGSQPPIGALGTIPQTSAIATHADRGKSWMVEVSPVAASASFLSVGNDNWNHGNGDIAIFAQGKKSPIRTISAGMRAPNGSAFDSNGDLYIANNGSTKQPGDVTVYNPRTGRLIRTISDGISEPDYVTLDRSGELYVANYGNNSVTVYEAGSSRLLRTITKGIFSPNLKVQSRLDFSLRTEQ